MTSQERRRLWPRLLLLVLAAGGFWLWQRGPGPVRRTLTYELGADAASVTKLDMQLWDDQGSLVKREERTFEAPPNPELSQEVPLHRGPYRLRIFVERGPKRSSSQQTLWVGTPTEYRIQVPRS